eukprot:CAMPEP_0202480276 /NCGR_PEP_ID=MMETSP1361-20130828/331_1 /ASSEMBLY_ACC=CAM_ASM_000849 /TAXON_ID=210615 /ORGANISM="Staurosira complex sp., Strain CCMP2646" /LENGTH=136 /DNA_ID=CAMNT_0049107697 /DNA_START=7 /DNA_END=417 /DNA_ORIENTATION=+
MADPQQQQQQQQQPPPMVGAPSHVKEATSDIQQLVDSVKPQMEQQQQQQQQQHQQLSTVLSNDDYSFQATQYISQVVAGTIYFVKIRTIKKQHTPQDDDAATWWHVKIFQPLPYTREPPRVMGIQHCKMDDPLVAF